MKSTTKKRLLLSILILVIAFLQTYSLWISTDEKVDESELVYFAVGFFGGDFDPHWYGYGSIAMYLLSFFYYISYPFYYIFSEATSLDNYATMLYSSNYFVDYGRFIYSVVGVITAFVYIIILRRLTDNLLYIILFSLIFLTSIDSIYYSNYLRTDQLVALFVGITIYLSININKKNYYILSAVIAAAIATKISSLPIVLFFIYSSYILIKEKKIIYKDVFTAGFLLVLLIFMFQPYNDVLGFLREVTSKNTAIGVSFNEKIGLLFNTLSFNISKNIPKFVLYSLLLLPLSFKYYRKETLIALVTFFILLLPYLAGNGNVRAYWLITHYDILYFLAGLSILSSIRFIKNNPILRHLYIIYIVLIIISSIYTIYSNINNYLVVINYYKSNISNKSLAKNWIENNLMYKKDVVILMDMHKNHTLPKIYDKNDPKKSKVLTRDFIYNRNKNQYLNDIFEKYIHEEYLNSTHTGYYTLLNLRIDPTSSEKIGISINNLQLFYKEQNIPYKVTNTKHIDNLNVNRNTLTFDSIGNDPYLVIQPMSHVLLDDNFHVDFKVQNTGQAPVSVFWDIGNGFSSQNHIRLSNIEKTVLRKTQPKQNKTFGKVEAQRAEIVNLALKEKLKGSYFLTSPAIYNSFINKKTYKAGHFTISTPELFDQYYKFMISQQLIKRFDNGTGSPIEVYKVQ